jgi:hypothetical protein
MLGGNQIDKVEHPNQYALYKAIITCVQQYSNSHKCHVRCKLGTLPSEGKHSLNSPTKCEQRERKECYDEGTITRQSSNAKSTIYFLDSSFEKHKKQLTSSCDDEWQQENGKQPQLFIILHILLHHHRR